LEKVYRELDELRARLLYVVLKLQEQPSGATQERIIECTKFNSTRVVRLLKQLEEAGYIIKSQVYGDKSRKSIESRQARQLYEVDAINSITFKDSAVILLEMLKYQENGKDLEGKINVEEFIAYLLKGKKLRDFNRVDLLGNSRTRGKIDLLAENGEHIERVTPRFVKPRLKAKLQKLYLELVAEQPALEKLPALAVPKKATQQAKSAHS